MISQPESGGIFYFIKSEENKDRMFFFKGLINSNCKIIFMSFFKMLK